MVHSNPHEAYEVEFCHEDGKPIAMRSLRPEFLEFADSVHKLAA
jgi:hypothetical protein